MEYVKLKRIAKYPTGKLNSNAAVEDGKYPFFTCSHEVYRIDKYTYEGEYVLLGGNNANGDFPIFYYEGRFEAYQRTYLLQPIDNQAYNTRYLYYAIGLKLAQMKGSAAGTATKFLTKPIIDSIDIEKREYWQQKRIVEILSTYDKLIETNNKRIKILEQMAEELYKEWFVRFRFPGYERNSLINSKFGKSPKDFEIVKMQDVIDYYIGGGWGNDDEDKSFTEEAYVIRGTDFSHVSKGDLSTCPLRFHKSSNYKSRTLRPLDVIIEVSGGTAEQPVGRTLLVTKDTIERLGGKVICASFCKQIRLNQNIVSPYYFFYWMQFLYNTRIIDRFQLQSTGIINFQFEYFLRKGDLLLPPKELMDRFDERIIPIFDEISLISKQNENLIKQRDLLLPRLMSGKLEV